MRPADRPACSDLATAAGEPLAGTASRLRHWLMVEQPGPWGYDALRQSHLPRDVAAHLAVEGPRLGIRVLLVQRRDHPRGSARRCFAAFTGRKERGLVTFELPDVRDLLDLDLESLGRARWSGLGEPVSGPLFLVCTQGKRDACCARYGSPPARALARRADAWECTHVGGDRFAGNLVCFPHGLYYGRVTEAAARGIAEAYEDGRIVLEHYRGRSAYPPPVQAAEFELRRRLGLDGVDDLLLHEARRIGPGTYRVSFRSQAGELHATEVTETRLDERPLTCKSTRPGRPRGFAVLPLA